MGLFTKDIKSMEDLHGLQDIYAEQQIIKSLPKMIEKATNRDLSTGLKAHLEETNRQIERLQLSSRSSASSPAGHSVRLTALSRRPTRRSRKLRIRPYLTPPSSRTPKQSNIMRYAGMER